MRRPAGFTLLELIVVLAILALLAALAAPSFSRTIASARLRSGASEVRATLARARTLAVAGGQVRSVVFDLEKREYGIDNEASVRSLPDPVRLGPAAGSGRTEGARRRARALLPGRQRGRSRGDPDASRRRAHPGDRGPPHPHRMKRTLALLLMILGLPMLAGAPDERTGQESGRLVPQVSAPVAPGSFDGDLAALPKVQGWREGMPIRVATRKRPDIPPPPRAPEPVIDPVRQPDAGEGRIPGPVLNFAGIGATGSIPLLLRGVAIM